MSSFNHHAISLSLDSVNVENEHVWISGNDYIEHLHCTKWQPCMLNNIIVHYIVLKKIENEHELETREVL